MGRDAELRVAEPRETLSPTKSETPPAVGPCPRKRRFPDRYFGVTYFGVKNPGDRRLGDTLG